MSRSGAGNLCDVAPSRFERFERDGYFTPRGLDHPRSAVRSKSKAQSSNLAPAAATWFASCARSGLCARRRSLRIRRYART